MSLGEHNHGDRPAYPSDSTVLDQLHLHVKKSPEAVALVAPEGDTGDTGRLELSYAQMWAVIRKVAEVLIAARPSDSGHWIILVLPQGLQQVISVWGTLLSGCGYVPIDADTQAVRLRMLLRETQPCLAIGEAGVTPLAEAASEFGVAVGTFPGGACAGLVMGFDASEHMRDAKAAWPIPTIPALLLFSSGSTGVPKGIVYDHKWLMGGSYFVGQDLELTPRSRCLLRCSYVWSVSLYDLFPANMYGGTLVIPPKGGHLNVQYMAETISREGIHAVVMQPTLLNLLLDEHAASDAYPLRSLCHVVSSGEKLFTSTADAFVRAPGVCATLWNMYGATEAGCAYFRISSGEAEQLRAYTEGVPAGVPQAYVDVFVMTDAEAAVPDEPLRPVATGEPGEICFGDGGEGFMACGYWRRDELTAEKFVHTKSFGRLYRTGDVGRWQAGQLLVAGRLDRQVKVRGVRIQPEEIEARLKRYVERDGSMPIKACLAVPSPGPLVELTAFLETAPGGAIDVGAVRTFLLQELGRVYVPKHIVHLAEGLPRTASGKPDQPELRKRAAEQEQQGVAAGTPSGVTPPAEAVATVVPASLVLGAASINEQTGARVWEVDLGSKVWKFVHDHRYHNEPLLPGSGYVSLAAEVAEVTWPCWELHEVHFIKPLPLNPRRTVRIEATPAPGVATDAAHKRLDLTITSLLQSMGTIGESIVHCTCHVVGLTSPPPPPPPLACLSPAAAAETVSAYSVASLYAQLAESGFDYGPEFQLVVSAAQRGGEGVADGEVLRRVDSPFVVDPVEVDACFHLAPLISHLGFGGAPAAIATVRRLAGCPSSASQYRVLAENKGDGGMSFSAFDEKGAALYTLEGLQLGSFEADSPEVLRMRATEYKKDASAPLSGGTPLPWVVAMGPAARSSGATLAALLGAGGVCMWTPGAALVRPSPPQSVVFVVEDEEHLTALGLLLPGLQHDLPQAGRVWLVVIGEGVRWLSAARCWAAAAPGLMLSVVHARAGIGPACTALLDPRAPPHIEAAMLADAQSFRLERLPSSIAPPSIASDSSAPSSFVGLRLDGPVAVLALDGHPLAFALVHALHQLGAAATLVLPGTRPLTKPTAALLCSIGASGDDVHDIRLFSSFETICAEALQCATLCEMAALLPLDASSSTLASAGAAAASYRRARAGHASWAVFVPPLMDGLWFAPAAPAGFRRLSVPSFVGALPDVPPADALVSSALVCEALPKHWRHSDICAPLRVGSSAKSPVELRAFLLAELSESLHVEGDRIDEAIGIDHLGVTSLASLRLSQRLRRFLGRDIPAFALQSNPSIAELVATLSTHAETVSVEQAVRGRVVCLHGFRTSSAVLKQQMAPIVAVLETLGYEVVVPDGPHKTSGPAQFAAGLDEDDSYGWWTYEDETHESTPIGIDEAIDLVKSLGPAAGVIGFSQGGAMAAQVADDLSARWALLFSPVFVPGRPPRCSCPTLLARDPADEVEAATKRLVDELPPSRLRQLEHHEGHRLPVAGKWWDTVATFLEECASAEWGAAREEHGEAARVAEHTSTSSRKRVHSTDDSK